MVTVVVNLFAGPGTGKSTLASYVFSELKWEGINCELASEFAKDLVWEGRYNTLDNQIYVFGKQLHRIKRLIGKVDVIICDSPLLLSIFYKPEGLSKIFDDFVREVHSSFNNANYFIQRLKAYNPAGRMQTEAEAVEIDFKMKQFLVESKTDFKVVSGDRRGGHIIVQDLLERVAGSQIASIII